MFHYAKDLQSPAVQSEIRRCIRDLHYEWHDSILRLKGGLSIGAEYDHWASDDLGWRSDHNLIPIVGRNYVLDILLKNGTRSPALYAMIYKNNVSPTANWTLSDFVSTGGELVAADLDESSRQAPTWGTISAGSVDNSASRVTFTSDASGVVVWGAGLATTQTFSNTTGTLVSAAKFAIQRTLAAIDDELLLRITFTAASA